MPIAVVAASIGVGVFIRRPVGKLIAAAGRWTQGDFSVRVPVEGEDEVSRLAVTFNRMAHGLSERAAAERSAREAQMMFADVVAILPVGILLIDRKGNITHANTKARDIWLLDESSDVYNIRALRGWKRATGEAVPPGRSAAARALAGETCLGEELDILCFDGITHKTILSAALPIRNEAGMVRSVVIVNEDLTEIYAARREAEEANLAKSKFLAAASHDLRQPVQSLVMFNAVLSQRLAGHPAETVVKHMGASLDALQRLLSDLLEVSRLDAGSVQTHPQPVALGPLIDRLVTECTPRARSQGLRLRQVRTSTWTVSDPVLLERILRNLLENALRYTERGSILVGVRRHANGLRLCVVDSGIGIAPDQQALIFQEFYQVGNPGRNRDKGLGLGLAIVSRLCALLEHRIAVTSAPGRGSCFWVELPRLHVAPSEPAAPAPRDSASRQFTCANRVLVIDDESIVRDGLTACLESWGAKVLSAADADEALALCSSQDMHPSLIISDYRLGANRSGVEAVERLRAANGRPTPAIILTGDTDPANIAKIRDSGFMLLYKPVDPERLHAVVSAILAHGPPPEGRTPA
ncbi:MAG: response regulator [Zoogloea sp.]|nr:response regulator [Zoogloea sp.]